MIHKSSRILCRIKQKNHTQSCVIVLLDGRFGVLRISNFVNDVIGTYTILFFFTFPCPLSRIDIQNLGPVFRHRLRSRVMSIITRYELYKKYKMLQIIKSCLFNDKIELYCVDEGDDNDRENNYDDKDGNNNIMHPTYITV